MAKVKLGNVSPRAFPETRGRFMLSDTKHGAVVSKWPRSRPPAKTGYDYYRQTEFGLIAKWAANPLDLDLATAVEMAKGSEQVPRDILMMAAMGLYYEIVDPVGHVWESARMTTNPQYILDGITTEIGSMLFRAPVGWLGLPAGQPGQILATTGPQPYWTPAPAGTGGSIYTANQWGGASTSLFASKGVLIQPISPFTITAAYAPVAEVAGQSYKWGLYEIGPTSTITAVLSLSATYTAPATATTYRVVPLGAPPVLQPGTRYALLFTRTSATNTTSCGLNAGTGNCRSIPVIQSNTYLQYAQTNPAPGHTLSSSGTDAASHGLIATMS